MAKNQGDGIPDSEMKNYLVGKTNLYKYLTENPGVLDLLHEIKGKKDVQIVFAQLSGTNRGVLLDGLSLVSAYDKSGKDLSTTDRYIKTEDEKTIMQIMEDFTGLPFSMEERPKKFVGDIPVTTYKHI
jgi:hypothetical protein